MAKVNRVTEVPTIDVELVVVRAGNVAYGLDTANKIAVEVQTEDTDAIKLVVKGKLKAQKAEKKTITGNKITLTDNVFSPELALFLQGGEIVYAKEYKHTPSSELSAGKYYFGIGDMYLSFTLEEATTGEIVYNTGTGVCKANGKRVSAKFDYDYAEGATKLETTVEDDQKNIAGYNPPVAGSDEAGEVFTTECYSAQYDASGNIVRYEKITYPNCKGTPIALSSEDGAFRAPEYEINSAPSTGQTPYSIEYVPNLPALTN